MLTTIATFTELALLIYGVVLPVSFALYQSISDVYRKDETPIELKTKQATVSIQSIKTKTVPPSNPESDNQQSAKQTIKPRHFVVTTEGKAEQFDTLTFRALQDYVRQNKLQNKIKDSTGKGYGVLTKTQLANALSKVS